MSSRCDPSSAGHDEVLRHERLEYVQRGPGHRLGGVQRRAAGEHGETGEGPALVRRQQRPAPLERRRERALARGRVARAGAERVEAFAQPPGELGHRQHVDATGRQLDRERQPVQPAADLEQGRGVAFGQREPRITRLRDGDEERHGRRRWPGGRSSVAPVRWHYERVEVHQALGA
jgi:hypothetical protein